MSYDILWVNEQLAAGKSLREVIDVIKARRRRLRDPRYYTHEDQISDDDAAELRLLYRMREEGRI